MQIPPTSRPRKRQSTTLVFAIRAPLILFSINLPPRTTAWSSKSHFPEYPVPHSPNLPMFPIALLTLFATLCTAEVICNPRVPPNLIPPLQSCDYAIRRLEVVQQGCGPDPIVFSPTAAGPNVLSLPAIYVGAGPGYTPPTPVWCAIMILWVTFSEPRLPDSLYLELWNMSQELKTLGTCFVTQIWS